MSENLNEVINISGGKTNSNVTNDHQENWSGYNAGVSLTKEVKGVDFDLNLMYGNEDGLINQIAGFSLKKNFGAAKAKTAALVKKPKLPKIDESLTTQINDTDLREIETLKSLNKELKAENAELKAQNEKLKLLAQKALQQNKAKEKLAIEVLKENEKLKLTNQILKNRILENENEQLRQSIEQEFNKFSMFGYILFLFIFIFLPALVLTLLVGYIVNRIRFRMATN